MAYLIFNQSFACFPSHNIIRIKSLESENALMFFYQTVFFHELSEVFYQSQLC